jgi:hypothetical protein
MGLRDEIVNYEEGDGLISCVANPTHTFRTCDNGVLFCSEYYLMLAMNGLLVEQDKIDYAAKIRACYVSGSTGLVARAPGDQGDTDPDDYHGMFAACVVLGLPDLGKEVLDWGLSHCGSYNPQNPQQWTGASCLFRMPQLLAAAYCAAGQVPFDMWSLLGVAAGVIATSCVNDATSDTDSRILSWCLIQACSPYSFDCREAAKLWYARLYKDYGPTGMLAVAQIYFPVGHPFREYWVTEPK